MQKNNAIKFKSMNQKTFNSIAVPQLLFDLGFEKKLYSQVLPFHPCTATSIDYLLQLL